ncbi:predicted protein [Chaetoceros tenuissimus]|uniref:Uncharacterized protein n=1 Tax=Chaetoceros tenuissimus TaxID=426638 RepID=A0AAD3H195_9STRA|nr:predicted protein [Chaetoceros tenuissimus]
MMKLGHILALLLADSAFGRNYGSDRSKCETPECYKDFIIKNVEIRENCDIDGLESGTLVYLNNCKVDKASLHIEWDEKTQMDIKGEYRLRFVTEQYTFVKQPRDTGCHCYDIGWSQLPILLEKFEEGFYCSDYSNFTDCSGIDYRKNPVPETFRYKERGPLRSLVKYYKYTKHVQLLDNHGITIKLEHSDKLGRYPYIDNVGRSTSDYLAKSPASLRNNSFVRANETIKSCEQQDGSACYLNTVYSLDLIEGSEYHDHRLGDIRLTSSAYTPDKVSLVGTFLRDANNRSSIGKFGIVLWYTADCDRSLQDTLNDWQNWYNKTDDMIGDGPSLKVEVSSSIIAVVALLLGYCTIDQLTPKKMVIGGEECIRNDHTILRIFKWITFVFSAILVLVLPAEYQSFLEFLVPLLLILMFRLREWILRKRGYLQAHDNNDENNKKHGFAVEEGGHVATDCSRGNPQDVEREPLVRWRRQNKI